MVDISDETTQGEDGVSSQITLSISRYVNLLSEGSKFQRKKAIEAIRKETIDVTPDIQSSTLQAVFCELLKHMLKLFSDSAENIREAAIQLVRDVLQKIPEPTDFLPQLMPVLVERLGQQDMNEPSEELRLSLVVLMSQIVIFSTDRLYIYLDDFIKIFIRTIVDPYPDVKKESCKCASALSKKTKSHFHMQSESLITPLLLTMTHQHSRVRCSAIECIGDVIQNGNGKSVDDVVSHLAQRLFDQAPAVRKAVTIVVGGWLLDLLDRYSFHHKLIPLLLTSLSDEVPEIQDEAATLWHDVGLKYASENESDLKEKQDFVKPSPSHYPPGVERPNLGCRTLMFRHISKILPALVRDIGDWVVATRVKASQLLPDLIINSEEYVTQHMEPLLHGLYKGCGDEESEVRKNVFWSAQLVGYFVEPSVWVKLVLSNVETSQSYNSLAVLSNIIKGSNPVLLKPYFSSISNLISSPDICHSNQVSIHCQLLCCVDGLLCVFGEDATLHSFELFSVLLAISALCSDQSILTQLQEVFMKLSDVHKFDEVEKLYALHIDQILSEYKHRFNTWTSLSLERIIFDQLLLDSGAVVGEKLDEIITIITACVHVDKDPEMRLKFFTLLSKLVMNSTQNVNSINQFGSHCGTVVKDMIIPNCVWKAGKVAGAIRTIAVACLWTLFKSGVLTKDRILPMVNELLTQLISLLDDTNPSTRLTTCQATTHLFRMMAGHLDMDLVHNMYPELLKRLDDSKDDIRLAVCNTFHAYFACFENNYNVNLYKAHIEAIYRGLLVHMDDPELKIQEAVYELLKVSTNIHPPLLKAETEAVISKHRTTKYCNDLISLVDKLRVEHQAS